MVTPHDGARDASDARAPAMTRGRLEAFSDGVLAIVLTILVLELKVPHEASWAALATQAPVFLGYLLSFLYVAIYWNNHHHMFQTVKHVSGPILWANLHLLFWLSLVPFTSEWMGATSFAQHPVQIYGVVLMMAATAYYVLSRVIIRHHGDRALLAAAVGRDWKGKISIALYAAGIGLSFENRWIGLASYWLIAFLWLVPDRRIERVVPDEPIEGRSGTDRA